MQFGFSKEDMKKAGAAIREASAKLRTQTIAAKMGVSENAAREAVNIHTTLTLPKSNRSIDVDALEALAIDAAVKAETPATGMGSWFSPSKTTAQLHAAGVTAVLKVLYLEGVTATAGDKNVNLLMQAAHRINGNKSHEALPPR